MFIRLGLRTRNALAAVRSSDVHAVHSMGTLTCTQAVADDLCFSTDREHRKAGCCYGD